MKLDLDEILRYLRMGQAPADAPLLARIETLKNEVLAVAEPKYGALLVPVIYGHNSYQVGPLTLTSADLKRALRGATKAYLFAATLGLGVDRLLRRTTITSASDALIVQAIATSAIERFADDAEASLTGPRTPRFSPGYGDLPLESQREFLAALGKHSPGITLTDTSLMIPSKSITAIIGVLS